MNADSLLARLPRIDPAEAELRRQLLAALNGRPWRHGPLEAGIVSGPVTAGPWFLCANGCAFHLAGDVPAIRRAGEGFDGIDAAAALEAGEARLADVEAALGVDLAPASLAADRPPDALIVTLRAGLDRLTLAWPPALPFLPAPPPAFAAPLAAHVPFTLAIAFAGPRLPPHDAAGLAPGDLLLLGEAPFAGTATAGGWEAGIAFDPRRRTLRLLAHGIHQTETFMDDPTDSPAPAQDPPADPIAVSPDFVVPLTIELESTLAPLRQLQALREGTVLPLEGSGTLAVQVRVNGQRLARGQLVAVGEGFGVLIEERLES